MRPSDRNLDKQRKKIESFLFSLLLLHNSLSKWKLQMTKDDNGVTVAGKFYNAPSRHSGYAVLQVSIVMTIQLIDKQWNRLRSILEWKIFGHQVPSWKCGCNLIYCFVYSISICFPTPRHDVNTASWAACANWCWFCSLCCWHGKEV